MRIELPCFLRIQFVDGPKSRSCQIGVVHLEGDPFATEKIGGRESVAQRRQYASALPAGARAGDRTQTGPRFLARLPSGSFLTGLKTGFSGRAFVL